MQYECHKQQAGIQAIASVDGNPTLGMEHNETIRYVSLCIILLYSLQDHVVYSWYVITGMTLILTFLIPLTLLISPFAWLATAFSRLIGASIVT